MAQRLLYLIRHAQYNQQDREEGALTELGVQQALATGQALKSLPITAAHYSTVRRAVETSDAIAQITPDVPRHASDLLRECIPPMESHLVDFFALRGPFVSRHQMGECARRIDSALETFFRPPDIQSGDIHELLVCHGNVIRYLVARTLGAPVTAWTMMLINNCGITRIVINEAGQPFLLSFNDTGHLPSHMLTDH